MRHYIPVDLSGAAGTDVVQRVSLGRNVKLLGVLLVGEAITGHASNFVDFNVFAADGSTLLWNRDTDSGNDGSTVAGTVYGVSPDETLTAEVAFESGYGANDSLTHSQAFKVSAIHSGTGAVVKSILTLILEDGRSYS